MPPFFRTILFAIVLMVLPLSLFAQVEITNVTSSQRDDDSGLVDIRYQLSKASVPKTISVRVSPDGGGTWQAVSSVTGDVGPNIGNGTRSIVWNAGADVPDIYWPNAQIEVQALGTDLKDDEITIILPGGVPLVMILIPAGSFVMGSPTDERFREINEDPQTNVTLSQNFYMGKYEVTQEQWQAIMGTAPPGIPGGPNHPVDGVSWIEARSFITQLNAYILSTGQSPSAVRLPTEAEWEYSARGGTMTRFHFGDSLSVLDFCEDDGIRSQHMWYCGEDGTGENGLFSQPVGQKLPNPYGLYDVHGNVWELCQDIYESSLPGGNLTDPTGPIRDNPLFDEDDYARVARGGGHASRAYNCRSARRRGVLPTSNLIEYGFRLASDG